MVVAVIPVRVVEVTVDEVVDMVPVRHHLVSAAGAVPVRGNMAVARVIGRADVGMLGIDGHDVFIDVIPVRVVEMPVVQVVDVAVVQDCAVAAARPVLVWVVLVRGMSAHGQTLQRRRRARQAARSKTRSQPTHGLCRCPAVVLPVRSPMPIFGPGRSRSTPPRVWSARGSSGA